MQFLLSVSFLVAQSSAWSWTVSNASNFGPKVSGHACAVSEDPGRIMIFGGLTGSAGSPTTADLWEWKGGKEVWDRLPGKAEEGAARPGRRMYAASAVLGGRHRLRHLSARVPSHTYNFKLLFVRPSGFQDRMFSLYFLRKPSPLHFHARVRRHERHAFRLFGLR